MAQEELIDSRVSVKQCKLAVEALVSHETKRQEKLEETELLPGKEQNVWLNVVVKKIPSTTKFKPSKIPIVHPIVDPRTTSICLITKDPQREYKDLLEAKGVKFISRVVGLEKLKGKFKPYEARRMLLKENGMFLADERILPLLPKLLGSKWFEAKKQPIPVCLTRKDLKGELERAISSTYMNQNQGTCTSIKISTLSHKPAQVLANIKKAIPEIAKNIQGGWENIQSFNIKTNSSVSLPIWSCNLDTAEGGRWAGLEVGSENGEQVSADGDHDEEKMLIETSTAGKPSEGKGKRRISEGEDDDVPKEKSRKKAKEAVPKATSTRESLATTLKPISPTTSNNLPNDDKPTDDGKSKSKKRKAAAGSVPNDDKPTDDGKSKSKKRKAAAPSVPSTIKPTPPPIAAKKSSVSPSQLQQSSSAPVEQVGPIKDAGKKKVSEVAEEKSASITSEELKKKRNKGVERKKEIIIKSKGGKSAKNALLGKKVAQG